MTLDLTSELVPPDPTDREGVPIGDPPENTSNSEPTPATNPPSTP